ncbi:MAG: Crp/Fnr family transcriptional regulator [Calditrichaeota bacterium]|nr:Crp/Fnr family transcriptional regulator [Calditrichota bacterium]
MYDRLIRHVRNYIPASDKDIDVFTSLISKRQLRKRQFLLQAGDVCNVECFVDSGCLRSYYVDDKGEEHITMFAVEDWWIGDIQSFVNQVPANFHIEALENSTLFQLSRSNQEILFEKAPIFERYIRLLVQNAFMAFQNRLVATYSQRAEQRYAEFIKRYPTILQRVPQYMIASYLGITPEFLSKIRSNS